MNWSELTWQKTEPIYQKILDMPFIKEMSNGTLPQEKFQFYMAQDSIYLEHFGKALALIAAKARDSEDSLAFTKFSGEAIVAEHILHTTYFSDFGVTEKGTAQPACHHYIHYLKSTVALESLEIGVAAVLPCFWIYKKVGDYIYSTSKIESNPYQRWIDMYAGEEFGESVSKALQIANKLAEETTEETRKLMTEAFLTASKLEYDFWNAAYILRKW